MKFDRSSVGVDCNNIIIKKTIPHFYLSIYLSIGEVTLEIRNKMAIIKFYRYFRGYFYVLSYMLFQNIMCNSFDYNRNCNRKKNRTNINLGYQTNHYKLHLYNTFYFSSVHFIFARFE